MAAAADHDWVHVAEEESDSDESFFSSTDSMDDDGEACSCSDWTEVNDDDDDDSEDDDDTAGKDDGAIEAGGGDDHAVRSTTPEAAATVLHGVKVVDGETAVVAEDQHDVDGGQQVTDAEAYFDSYVAGPAGHDYANAFHGNGGNDYGGGCYANNAFHGNGDAEAYFDGYVAGPVGYDYANAFHGNGGGHANAFHGNADMGGYYANSFHKDGGYAGIANNAFHGSGGNDCFGFTTDAEACYGYGSGYKYNPYGSYGGYGYGYGGGYGGGYGFGLVQDGVVMYQVPRYDPYAAAGTMMKPLEVRLRVPCWYVAGGVPVYYPAP